MLEGTRVVDVHHHFLPENVFEMLRRQAGGAKRLINDDISITLSEDLHRADRHLEAMDAGGVDTAILTYSGVSVLGIDVCRELNDGLAAVQRAHAGRLYGAIHVPLQQPEVAPRELERGARELGLGAVGLPTSARGVRLDAPGLAPLWEATAALDLPVILHPALLPEGASTDYHLERSCFRPFDTTTAAVRLMHAVLPRFPTLRFVLPHLGGTSVFLNGRLRMFFEPPGWDGPEERRGLAKTRREQQERGLIAAFDEGWRKFWFDTAGTGGWAPAVQMTADVVGTDRMLFGSDYPLETYSGESVRELVDLLAGLPLPVAARQAIAGTNAAALFGVLSAEC